MTPFLTKFLKGAFRLVIICLCLNGLYHLRSHKEAPPTQAPLSCGREAGASEFYEQTHFVCWARNSGDTCKNASKKVRIPRSHAAHIERSGAKALDFEKIDLDKSLVFLTAASSNHFLESLGLIENLQTVLPGKKIIYWDIGLTAQQAANVSTLCGVTYRKFNFSGYPAHVKSLVTYAFKSLAVLESFEKHSVVWWVDSSIRFLSANMTPVYQKVRERRGLLTFLGPGHFVFAATHRQMYDYLATDTERLKTTKCVMGGSFIIANTRELYDRILRWYYACSLDVRCIAPVSRPTACNFTKSGLEFANCHRFDQCVLSILSANMWEFNGKMHATPQLNFKVLRGSRSNGSVRYCRRT